MTNISQNESSVHSDHTVSMAGGSFQTSITVTLFLLSILIMSSNFLTILAISTNTVLKTLQNRYIIALAKADMFVGLSNLLLLIQKFAYPHGKWIECQYTTAILYSSINFSLFILLSVALDRYLYIVHPFIYMRHMTSKKINILLVVQWTLATIHGFLAAYIPTGGDDSEKCNPLKAFELPFVKHVFPAIFSFVCCGTLVLYGLIARTAKKHWDRKVQRLHLLKSAGKSSPDVTSLHVRSAGIKLRLFTKSPETKTINADVKRSSVNTRCPLSSKVVRQPQSMEIAENADPATNKDSTLKYFETNKVIDTDIDLQEETCSNKLNDRGIANVLNDTASDKLNDTDTISSLNDNASDKLKDTGTIDVMENTCNEILTYTDQIKVTSNISKSKLTEIDKWNLGSQSNLSDNETGQLTVTDTVHSVTVTDTVHSVTLLCSSVSDSPSVKANGQSVSDNIPPRVCTSVWYSGSTVAIGAGADLIKVLSTSADHRVTSETSAVGSVNANIEHTSPNELPGSSPTLTSSGQTIATPLPDPPNGGALTTSPEAANNNGPEQQVRGGVSPKSLRWLRLMVLVFGLFFLCWAPIMITILVSWAHKVPSEITEVFSMLGLANSAVNFFVYALHTRQFRQVIAKRISCRCRD